MNYVAKRLITVIPVLFILSILVFGLIHLIPGGPAQAVLGQEATPSALAALRAQLGLNQPVPIQYTTWLWHALHGNLGTSLVNGEPVTLLIMQRLPETLELAIGTIVVAVLVSFPFGIMAAVYRGKWADTAALFASTIGIAVPPFWLGLVLLILFTVKWHLFPSSGYVPIWDNVGQNLRVMLLPIVATGVREAGVLMRMLRSSLLDILDADFIRTARAKGLRGWAVIVGHALQNALIPVITTGGLEIAALLGGLVITEQMFSLPGFGTLLIQSIFSRDYTTVQGAALFVAVGVVLVNVVVDIFYGIADPRMRLGKGA
ncbi:ABC transporter permease [Alicyclobacillus sp. SO9]|uniref:ABC transporter permease n=1 Tax=Alicyclobacillus sp. SO9 TaxID=2665646 RepID=UPI0018E78952|nr:ABC transporter permease [Alicyclobacillus sp. SO9]QQE79359.1 ABC transporter permease [Alicyclobacillus sp. SO9]